MGKFMNKNEIYEAIGYKGQYSKDVKRKLRLLMKKFHPDVNSGNDQMMKLLVEVKNELISNKVSYIKQEKPRKKKVEEEKIQEDQTIDDFKKISIQDLTKKVNDLLKDMVAFQTTLFKFYKQMAKEESEYFKIYKKYKDTLTQIETLEDKIKSIRCISKIEMFCFLLCLMNLVFLLFQFNVFSLLFMIFFGIASFLLFFLRLSKIKFLTDKVYDLEIDSLIIKKDLQVQDDLLQEFKQKEGNLKRTIQRLKDDITFYNHILAKKTNRNRSYTYEHKNVYTKRK